MTAVDVKTTFGRDDPAVRFLLRSRDPSVRYLTLLEVLDAPADSPMVRGLRAQVPRGPRVRALLAGQPPDGGFGVHPYKKWDGAHWRLVSLIELGLPPGHSKALAAAEQVLRWLTGDAHRERIVQINGLWRRCASQEGNALAVCSRLGLAGDPRAQNLARDLLHWQWPDGGWNCDKRPTAHHSSFYESLAPLWGLTEYRRASGSGIVTESVERICEFFLRHRLFRSERTGAVIDTRRVDGHRKDNRSRDAEAWVKLHYPLYWHYDILQGLLILARAGMVSDPRTHEALDIVERKRQPDGTWHVEGCYWHPPGRSRSNVEVVDWGRKGPNEMITLNALRVLKAAGRLG